MKRSVHAHPGSLPLVVLLGLFPVIGCGDAEGDEDGRVVVDAGSLRLRVVESPWRMSFVDGEGARILIEHDGTGEGPTGALGMHLGPPPVGGGETPTLPPAPLDRQRGWVHVRGVVSSQTEEGAYRATLLTSDPDRTLELEATREAEGVIRVTVQASEPEGVQALGVGFVAGEDERFLGFGERSNAVSQSDVTLEHYVADGPYYDATEYAIMELILPAWGTRRRPDSTYFPIPWLLSTAGYGVLLDNDELSYHRLRSDDPEAWSLEVEASQMTFRVFAGPTPADALGRYTDAVGRQPDDYAPWFFGPWLQTDADSRIAEARLDDVPTSVNATYLHYLPCGSHQGGEGEQLARTSATHEMGVAIHTYFNPMLCVSYEPVFGDAEAKGALIEHPDGRTYVYDYCSNVGSCFEVSQFDFASGSGVTGYGELTDEALEHGYDGWMEDFGEYTPLDAVSADGATGTAFHNRYARDFHCGVFQGTSDVDRPLARFARSGWTASAACTPIVWGGDPTTGWGFDGLESSIYRALSLGTSGVGIWGSDIGGFMSLFGNQLDDEMLDRWIAWGALSVVMRTQKNGVRVPDYERPQVWDEAHWPVWRRYAKLHTQLFPYLQAAAETYYATGQPIMQHHALTHPDDPEAVARDDQYMFGPDLLVAPVYEVGATDRTLYLPEGVWAEWWRSVTYGEQGGTFTLADAALHDGARSVTVSAPIEEIPMFVRAGAIVPMITPDVFTLAEYGDDPDIVHASDRDDRLHVLAFPRGETAGTFYDDGHWTSVEAGGAWRLTLDHGGDARTVHLEASVGSLVAPFDVCGVTVDGTPVPERDWSYDAATQVLDVTYTVTSGTLTAAGC